ncbi:hypothetical protein PRZ48_006194 [Zasmidium cellare]|uniref:Uncharacterized protein n=1 Tax=Zasmidium cellare TaxID=395010 RepID=A0ABR0ENU3_ZASCE|nr:hypothetical protein PRZ48_006194 [Zasmidium cellare]
MLQRTLQRSLQRQLPSVVHSKHVCACICGRQLAAPTDTHHRKYATKRRAPSTFDRDERLKRRALTPEEAREVQDIETEKHGLFFDLLSDLQNTAGLSLIPDTAIEFLNAFDKLAKQAKGRPTVDPDSFLKLTEEYGATQEDCRTLSRALLVVSQYMPERGILGKKLLLSSSRAGHEESTIHVMGHAVLQHLQRPGALRSKEIQTAREHLDQIVAEGNNYRAIVLKGRIAEVLGDEMTAIKMWTSAMASAVEAAAIADREITEGVREKKHQPDQFQLTSPWIDLFHIHRRRGEARQANWAIEIGCQQDDPDAHYLYADYSCMKYHDYEQTHPMWTSEWLFHMMKAATSGHKRAAYELGEFYAQSSWKYIEDEPPDDMKPTPFDSYPAAKTETQSWWETLQAFLGAKPVQRSQRAEHGMFDVAAFPSDAKLRFRIALDWASIAMNYGYAPASLLKGKIHMTKTLDSFKSSPRTAPKEAIELSNKRYTYASKEDYEAGLRINPNDAIPDEEDEVITGPPNPFYNLNLAKLYIRDVFYAHMAHTKMDAAKKRYVKERRLGLVKAATNDDDIISEDNFKDSPEYIRKWFRHQEVREQYEDKVEDYYREARDICDSEEWDLYGDDGGLVYRARRAVGSSRPAAAAAA